MGCVLFDDGHVTGEHCCLLGDSGYPGKQWLLTPYLNPQPGAQTAVTGKYVKHSGKLIKVNEISLYMQYTCISMKLMYIYATEN